MSYAHFTTGVIRKKEDKDSLYAGLSRSVMVQVDEPQLLDMTMEAAGLSAREISVVQARRYGVPLRELEVQLGVSDSQLSRTLHQAIRKMQSVRQQVLDCISHTCIEPLPIRHCPRGTERCRKTGVCPFK